MHRHGYKYVTPYGTRWRATVRLPDRKQQHVGIYTSEEKAARYADKYIVRHIESESLALLGTYSLNFPEDQPSLEERAIEYLEKQGYTITKTDAPATPTTGTVELIEPEKNDDIEQYVAEYHKQVEIQQWFRQQPFELSKWADDGYWDNEKHKALFPTYAEFYTAVREGQYDPR
jgi:hypothetical protein